MPNFGQEMQLEVYGSARSTSSEPFPFACEEWEERARKVLSDEAYWYVAGAAGGGDTMRANRDAFYEWRIRPRMLVDVTDRDVSVELFGRRFPVPVMLAPVGVQGILHPDGEAAAARAAASIGVPVVLSNVSSVTLEEVAAATGDSPHWFQLYPGSNRDVMASAIARAEAAHYSAIVVTLDTKMLGWREADLRGGYLPFLKGQGIANYLSDPAFRGLLPRTPEEDPRSAIMLFLSLFANSAMSWSDVQWIRSRTRLPLLLKGILDPDDARIAIDKGADGVIVSNHGGRQVDGAVAALDALPAVVDAVAGAVPVLMDSGVRRGADVIKAIALGARAVLVGRPYAYALATGGEEAVRHYLRCLIADIDINLALSGRRTLAELNRSALERAA
ncbi:MAG TPA: alpha-hydroxy-acid oxidizing protein [Gemmatimonadaceae bacterium]